MYTYIIMKYLLAGLNHAHSPISCCPTQRGCHPSKCPWGRYVLPLAWYISHIEM